MQVYFKNQGEFDRKVEKLADDGVDKMQVVIDFDRTMTLSMVDGLQAANSFTALTQSKFLGDEYGILMEEMFKLYHPMEIDPQLSHAEKLPLMAEWTMKVIEAMCQHGLRYEHFQKIVDSDLLPLREGVVEFFSEAIKRSIQVIVFSAGMGDLIDLVLLKNKLKSEMIHVVANYLNFDAEGRCLGLKGDLINILNKNESMLVDKAFFPELRRRHNVLLVGDSMHDIHMVDGIVQETVLKVGLLNHPSEEALQRYMGVYDMVLAGDGHFTPVAELLKRITTKTA